MKIRLLFAYCLAGMPIITLSLVFKAHLPQDWYPSKRQELERVMQGLNERASSYKSSKEGHVPSAIIVPHAAYEYSGDIAAVAYRQISGKGIKRVIVFAPSHFHPFDGIVIPNFDHHNTPLGSLQVDTACIAYLKKNALFRVEEAAWKPEHALEVQLPFVQKYIGMSTMIVPLIVGNATQEQLDSIARQLIPYIDDHTLIVVSSDFTHYGKRFGYTPFTNIAPALIQEHIKNLDSIMIKAITDQDEDQFNSIQKKYRATVCGSMPIRLFKTIQRNMPNITRGTLLAYKTSYEVTKSDPATSVSYAAIIFDRYFSAEDKQKMMLYVRKVLRDTCHKQLASEHVPLLSMVRAQEKRGVFVTLRNKKTNELRGCMGSIMPVSSLYMALYNAANNAAYHDPRFAPVTCNELSDLFIEISILTQPHNIKNYKEIDLGIDGIVLSKSGKSAVFLPKVATEYHWNLETTLQQLARKAGLSLQAWNDPETEFKVFQSIDFKEV